MSTNLEQKNFFRECLYTALMDLMNKKSIDKIGIGELCSKAGVSRMTCKEFLEELTRIGNEITEFVRKLSECK